MSIKQDRNMEIRRMRESGMNLEQIGTHFGITKERVRQIVNNKEPNRPTGRPLQLGLYDEMTVKTIVSAAPISHAKRLIPRSKRRNDCSIERTMR